MTIKGNNIYKTHINRVLSNINGWRKEFITETLILFLCIKGRINFLQLGRFGKHKEQRYRQQFEKPFDYLTFNKELTLSYGIYLYHMIILVGVHYYWDYFNIYDNILIDTIGKLSISLILSLVICWLSYKYIESPFLNLKKKFK